MKLLIVDDQHSVSLYLQKVLDLPALGFEEVRYAENGLHALDMIAKSPPDIMLMEELAETEMSQFGMSASSLLHWSEISAVVISLSSFR